MAVSSICLHVIAYTLALLLSPFTHTCAASCYFPIELQGDFMMQSTVVAGSQVQYSQVNISAEAIPIWGHCHRRISHNVVILMDSSGGPNCIRCFHLNLRSRNVLQVHTEGLDKCYTTEEAAEATCPDLANQSERSTEILLYKTKELGGENITEEYCPINGRFTFTYDVDDGSENKVECPMAVSELDNCPSGAELKLRFRRCSFEDFEITFQCLGHWAGLGNQRYLALLEKTVRKEGRRSALPMRDGEGPRYRCALYREDPGTGNIAMAFSSDSTCRSDLHSATKGFEILNLSFLPQPNWPQQVTSGNCRYPSWMQGQWQHLNVDNNVLTYQDHKTFKTYSLRCVGPDSGPTAERFMVFGRTQCGEEIYSCIWIKRRGANVLEFQLGLHNSTSSLNSSLCYDSNFEQKTWKTQGRVERIQESPCPIPGEYTGVIPDAGGLCAKLWSDCKSPETMYYTVSDCNSPEVYEGNWRQGPRRRNRRQAGTGIYRISNPRTTSHLSTTTTPTPTTESPLNPLPVEHRTRAEKQFSYYSSPGPRYPNTYQSPANRTEPPEEEGAYDPWEFPQTHGVQVPKANYKPPNVHRELPINGNPWSYDRVNPDPYGYRERDRRPSWNRGSERGGYSRDRPYDNQWNSRDYEPGPRHTGAHWGQGQGPGQAHRDDARIPNTQKPEAATPVPVFADTRSRTVVTGERRVPVLVPLPMSPREPPVHRSKERPNTASRHAGPSLREEREYRCLGQWEEDGLVYTYTQRRDVSTYECFVGKIINDSRIYIKEAGDHCERGMDPERYGMELSMRGPCYRGQPSKDVTLRPQPPGPRYTKKPLPEPTKPWKPITGRPQASGAESCSITRVTVLYAASVFVLTRLFAT